MELLLFGVTVGIFYCVLFFFDTFFKSCMHYPYEAFLRGTGLTIKLLRLQWYTTTLNRTIFKIGHTYPKFFGTSFDIGICVSLILLPVIFLFYLFDGLFGGTEVKNTNIASGAGDISDDHSTTIALAVMIPSVNLPMNEIWYYIGALGLCACIHELGHAFAAVLEDVPVTGFGLNVIFIFPFAFVRISTEHLHSLKLWRKLRILCAGIWHNVALSLVAYVIYLMLAIIFMPLYSSNAGVIITQISEHSTLIGAKGLNVGDVVTRINDCDVSQMDDWYDCLLNTIKYHPAYCITEDFVRHNDESVPVSHANDGITECCDVKSEGNLCFEHMSESFTGLLELQQFMCLNMRNVVQNSSGYCHKGFRCDESFCIKPQLNNATTIVQILRSKKPNVLYIGHPADISRTVRVSEFIPKSRFFGPIVPDSIALFLKYIVVFSFGLAVVNVIPIFGFDGQHIVSAILNLCLAVVIPARSKRDMIVFYVNCIGTIIFGCAIIKMLWTTLLAAS